MRPGKPAFLLSGLGIVLLALGFGSRGWSQGPGKSDPPPPIPPESLLKSDVWKDAPRTPLQPGEIDRLLEKEFAARRITPAPLTSDEQFLRRVRLDLTGQLPTVAEIEQFAADKDPAKRAKLVDKLLDSDEYARHWARYWREVVMAVEAPFGDAHAPAFEKWLFEQLKQNRGWGDIVRDLVTAQGFLRKNPKADEKQTPAVFFLGRHNGVDGDIDRAAETSRLFLGIQLQCAQCHNDRRTRIWKQFQFHELSGFYSRMAVGGSNGEFIKVESKNNGEHKMPSKDAKPPTLTLPRFLDGKAPAPNASDKDRRQALADYLTDKDNYWFAAAYVNRMWSELLGQAFYERVDDLSPKSEVLFPSVASRLAASFSGSNYDGKALLRAIVNSQAYQRKTRLGDSITQHLQFAAVFPTRVDAEVLWQALSRPLVRMPTDQSTLPAFRAEFAFDPSLKADEVVSTIGQALWLLNSTTVNDRVKVGDIRTVQRPDLKKPPTTSTDPSLLKQLLAKHGEDDPAVVRGLYLQTLARKPTDKELDLCMQYIQETKAAKGTRNEALEDVLKALINTAEFQRKR
jgi:hypothetical protein